MADQIGRHTRRAVAQIDQYAAPSLLKGFQRRVDRHAAAENVADDVGAMQPRRNVAAIADLAGDQRKMLHRIEWRDEGVAGELAESVC